MSSLYNPFWLPCPLLGLLAAAPGPPHLLTGLSTVWSCLPWTLPGMSAFGYALSFIYSEGSSPPYLGPATSLPLYYCFSSIWCQNPGPVTFLSFLPSFLFSFTYHVGGFHNWLFHESCLCNSVPVTHRNLTGPPAHHCLLYLRDPWRLLLTRWAQKTDSDETHCGLLHLQLDLVL